MVTERVLIKVFILINPILLTQLIQFSPGLILTLHAWCDLDADRDVDADRNMQQIKNTIKYCTFIKNILMRVDFRFL